MSLVSHLTEFKKSTCESKETFLIKSTNKLMAKQLIAQSKLQKYIPKY
jgi:hypothetical protein